MKDAEADFGPYQVRHYPRDPDRLVIVFASAGRKGAIRTTEEFRNSLWDSGVSLCFVWDSEPSWYNHDATPQMMDHVADLSSAYRHVGALGHSMGASGAIVFAGHCRQVERVLAFSPQFSLADPFIRFDDRFNRIGPLHPNQRYSTFHALERSDRIVVLYGTEEWADLVHAGVYAVHGYDLGFVAGSGHLVPQALKSATEGNLLVDLAARFADFSGPFDYDAVKAVLGGRVSRQISTREWAFGEAPGVTSGVEPAAASPERLTDLAKGRATD